RNVFQHAYQPCWARGCCVAERRVGDRSREATDNEQRTPNPVASRDGATRRYRSKQRRLIERHCQSSTGTQGKRRNQRGEPPAESYPAGHSTNSQFLKGSFMRALLCLVVLS